MTERNDQDLRDHFEALRREDLERATPFKTVLARAPARRAGPSRRGPLGLAAAALVLAGVVLALLVAHRHRDGGDLATVRWRAPTDFLLQLPGDDLLRTVPELGRVTWPSAGFNPQDTDRRTP